MCDEEFIFSVFPSNQHVTTNFISSSEFIIGIHADITLVSISDEYDEDVEYTSDLDYTTQERFLYNKDLKFGREELLQNQNVSRTALVNALTQMKVPEKYQNEIIDEVFCFVKDDIKFSQCEAISVDIEIVRYADDDDDEGGEDGDDDDGGGEDGDDDDEGGEDGDDDVIEPSFRMVAMDEKMRAENENCVICMGGYPVGSEVCMLKCHHFYHRRCLLEWLDKSVTCPICRSQPPNFCVAPEPTRN